MSLPSRRSIHLNAPALVLVGLALPGCDGGQRADAAKQSSQAPAPRVPVTIARAVREDVPIHVSAIGWVEPFATVTVKPQVAGELLEIHFKEGEDVAAGQPLFTIDPRPYEAALHLAEANLQRDQAMAEDARREAARLAALFEGSQASDRERQQSEATAEARRAQVRADQAEVEQARLRLAYCSIKSPINGRAGAFLVHRGSIVKADETELVVLNQIEPIYVAFSVPEQYLGAVKMQSAAGPLHVSVVMPDDASAPVDGVVTFYDNQVDTATGMVRLKAVFQNIDRRLWPGRFVNVTLTLGGITDAVVVPASAVLAGQSGSLVYVVKAGDVVEARSVGPGLTVAGRTVISEGLAGGEIVVTDGQLRLAPGAVIEPKNSLDEPSAATTQTASGDPM